MECDARQQVQERMVVTQLMTETENTGAHKVSNLNMECRNSTPAQGYGSVLSFCGYEGGEVRRGRGSHTLGQHNKQRKEELLEGFTQKNNTQTQNRMSTNEKKKRPGKKKW